MIEQKRQALTLALGLSITGLIVTAKLELTHNGYPILSVNNLEVTFNPGEEKSYDFNFTGVKGDSGIVAKITPVVPSDDMPAATN